MQLEEVEDLFGVRSSPGDSIGVPFKRYYTYDLAPNDSLRISIGSLLSRAIGHCEVAKIGITVEIRTGAVIAILFDIDKRTFHFDDSVLTRLRSLYGTEASREWEESKVAETHKFAWEARDSSSLDYDDFHCGSLNWGPRLWFRSSRWAELNNEIYSKVVDRIE